MDNGKKNSSKVLTTNDIRKHARDWTLAGDVGLLAYLEQFSENIINKTQETQNNFNELVDHYEELYTKVGNITNQFLALQNCQFVENRVYDEETPTEEKPEVKVIAETEKEKLLLMQYKEAVEVGVKILDTHFQEVQLPPNSDSDEEDEYSAGNSFIWKPKNPYASKKFPLLIGSAEWWADDHVGLGTNEDGLDTEKIISESESEMESLKSMEKTMKSSSSSSMENIPKKPTFLESSSEDLFGFDKNETQQIASENVSKGSSSLLGEPTSFLPDFEKEVNEKIETQSEEPPNQIDSKPKKVDNAFTRELMAKLVSVTNKNEKVEEKPRENPTTVKIGGDLFDETDDSSCLFSTQVKGNKIQEKVAGRKGLFDGDDDDDELVKGEKDLFSGDDLFKATEKHSFDGKSVEPSRVSERTEKKETVAPKKNLVNDLFDDLEDDDDTLFAAKTVIHKSVEKSLPSVETEEDIFNNSKPKSTSKLDWENDEGLFDGISTNVDDDFFNSSGLFDVKVNKAVDSPLVTDSKSEDALFPTDHHMEKKPTIDSVEKSILDSKTKNSVDDPFGFSSSKEPTNKKLVLDSDEEDDLFSKSFKEEKKPVKVLILPDDNDDDALFGERPKLPDSTSISSSRSSLFDDVSASKSRLASVFEKDKTTKPEDDLFNETDDPLFGGDVKTGKDLFTKGHEKESSSLFDDWDEGDDLFGATKKEDVKKIQEKERKVTDDVGDDLFGATKKENVKKIQEKEKKVIDDGDDLFGAAKKEDVKKIQEKEKKVTDDIGDDLFKSTKPRVTKSEIMLKPDDLDVDELFSEKSPSPKPKPPSSLSLKAKESEIKLNKPKSVGKLNIPDNLKVKFESAAKQISSGGGSVKPSAEEEKEVLDEPLQTSNLLKCPSKDRVKIPGRRRPQSRRARQEAIRNSGIWDEPTFPGNNSNTAQPKDSLPSPAASNPLSPSTDEEDFFKVPELDTNFEKEDQSIFKSDLFESVKSSKLDDNLLFDGAPVLSPLSPKITEQPPRPQKSTDSLFESGKTKTPCIFEGEDDNFGDDDDNLFKAATPPAGDSAPVFHAPEKSENKIKKSLFDLDDDDEDDLFGGKLHVTPSKPSTTENLKEGGGKEKGNYSFVDPLGLMTKDE